MSDVPVLEAAVSCASVSYPWNDQQFHDTVKLVQGSTMIDQNRLFVLWHLAHEAARRSTQRRPTMLEVGCWRGGSGAIISKSACISKPDSLTVLCDTFHGVVGADPGVDGAYQDGEHWDAKASDVSRLMVLRGLRWANMIIWKGEFPSSSPPVTSLCFAHIDVDVYKSARESFDWIWPRLEPGGIVVFDDYGNDRCPGIAKAVNECAEAHELDALFIPNLLLQAIFIKTANPIQT